MTQIAKAIALVSSLGAIGGVSAYSAGLFAKANKEPIQEIKTVSFKAKLAEEGFELITDNTEESWKDVLAAYKLSTTKTFSGQQETDKTKEQLKENCDSHLEKVIQDNYRENEGYQKLTQWCVKKTAMNKVLENAGLRILKFDQKSQTEEKNLLDDKVNKLKQNKVAFDAFKKASGDAITNKQTITIEVLKKGCTGLQTNTIETIKNDFLDKFF